MTNVDLRDLIINLVVGAVVTLVTLLLKRLFPGLDTDLLSLIASIVAILLLLVIHYLRVSALLTSEPVIIPLGVAVITIVAILLLIGPGRHLIPLARYLLNKATIVKLSTLR